MNSISMGTLLTEIGDLVNIKPYDYTIKHESLNTQKTQFEGEYKFNCLINNLTETVNVHVQPIDVVDMLYDLSPSVKDIKLCVNLSFDINQEQYKYSDATFKEYIRILKTVVDILDKITTRIKFDVILINAVARNIKEYEGKLKIYKSLIVKNLPSGYYIVEKRSKTYNSEMLYLINGNIK